MDVASECGYLAGGECGQWVKFTGVVIRRWVWSECIDV